MGRISSGMKEPSPSLSLFLLIFLLLLFFSRWGGGRKRFPGGRGEGGGPWLGRRREGEIVLRLRDGVEGVDTFAVGAEGRYLCAGGYTAGIDRALHVYPVLHHGVQDCVLGDRRLKRRGVWRLRSRGRFRSKL